MKLHDLKPAFIGVCVASLIALMPLSYGYYTFLRILVCGCAIVTASFALKTDKQKFLGWIAIPIGILFNPIIPIHLDLAIWSVFNIAVAIFFGLCAWKIEKQSHD